MSRYKLGGGHLGFDLPCNAATRKAPRPPWGHVSRHCVYCGKVGPRTMVPGGWAHKRCLPSKPTRPRP